MKHISSLILTLLFISVTSCEEVIVLDLDNGAPRLVIEGYITDQPGPYTISLSESAPFYDKNIFPAKSGATVMISDDQGNEDALIEVSPGVYQTTSLQGQRGVTYTLSVNLEGKTYNASSKMPEQLIELDSVTTEFEEESIFYEEGYYAIAHFNDPPDIANYFRFNIFVNGEVYIFVFEEEDKIYIDDNFWMWDDKYTDGNKNDYDFPHTLKKGDSVYVELHHLDRSTYDYYRTTVEVIDGSGVAPSNPLSNFGDSALGYFGAFSVTSNHIIVE